MEKYVPIDAKICPYIFVYVPIYFNFTKSEIDMYKNTPVSKIDTRANRKIVILD